MCLNFPLPDVWGSYYLLCWSTDVPQVDLTCILLPLYILLFKTKPSLPWTLAQQLFTKANTCPPLFNSPPFFNSMLLFKHLYWWYYCGHSQIPRTLPFLQEACLYSQPGSSFWLSCQYFTPIPTVTWWLQAGNLVACDMEVTCQHQLRLPFV